MKLFVGIDPGLSGYVASINEAGELRSYVKLPTKAKPGNSFIKKQIDAEELANILRTMITLDYPYIQLERVSSMAGQGVAGACSLTHTAGMIEGVCVTEYGEECFLETVPPANWMKELGLHGKKKVKGCNPIKEFVIDKFHISKRIGADACDAIAIAYYCYLKNS